MTTLTQPRQFFTKERCSTFITVSLRERVEVNSSLSVRTFVSPSFAEEVSSNKPSVPLPGRNKGCFAMIALLSGSSSEKNQRHDVVRSVTTAKRTFVIASTGRGSREKRQAGEGSGFGCADAAR